MKRMDSQKQIFEYTPAQIDAAINELKDTNILCNKDLIIHCLESTINLSTLLQRKNITIEKLLRSIYGNKSEKMVPGTNPVEEEKKNNENLSEGETSSLDVQNAMATSDGAPSNSEVKKEPDAPPKKKGHGRNPAKSYTGADVIKVAHATLHAGDPCPMGCSGKVYRYDSGIYVQIFGNNPLDALITETEKFRCNLCQAIFEAQIDEEIKKNKYTLSSLVTMALMKFELGVPYYRLENFQDNVGIPLPSSVQTESIEKVANSCYKVFQKLEDIAAKSSVLAFDDTKVKVLEFEKENKEAKDDPSFLKGYNATVIAAKMDDEYNTNTQAIALFYLDRNHAGQNFEQLMEKRPSELPRPLVMSDALPAYAQYKSEVIDLRCLGHARRKFFEIKNHYPIACDFILKKINLIYKLDDETKIKKLTNQERLEYHQEKSIPILNDIMERCEGELAITEPNDELSKAINYFLENWNPITNFVRIPGAMLDNNWVERIVKDIIKVRKNSLFFKTEMSSKIATVIMSIIETCKLCSVSSFHYLHFLLKHQNLVNKSPENFLPWNYQEFVEKLSNA